MSASCCSPPPLSADPLYRRVLWIALGINVAMFGIEIGAGWRSGSVSLLADAIDFFGDAVNYALALAVLSLALHVRSKAAIFKAACMAAFGLLVLGRAAWSWHTGVFPEAATMGAIAVLALVANGSVGGMLYRHRLGDANMRSVCAMTPSATSPSGSLRWAFRHRYGLA